MVQSIEQVTALRAQLWDDGYRPVPVFNSDAKVNSPGKQPLGDRWREEALKDPPLCAQSTAVAYALNTGILADGLRAIDIDVDDPTVAMRCKAMALDRFGEAPIRMRRNSARCLILYRAASGTPPKLSVTGKEHALGNGLKVEALGAGQQFVAYGTHDSGMELEWFPEGPDEIEAENLPAITEEDLFAFLQAIAPILGAPDPVKSSNGADHHAAADPQAEPLRVAAAVAGIPNTGPADWEGWNKIGMAIWAATGGSMIGGELFNEWSKRHPSYDPGETEQRWRHYQRSPPDRIGAGTLFHLARQNTTPEPPPSEMDDPNYWLSIDMDADVAPEPVYPRPEPLPYVTKVFDPWNTLQPVVFPIDAVPFILRDFVRSRAETIGADPCALAWSCISACSSAIHGNIRLQMKRHDAWTVPASIWVTLVGLPSTKKSPIIETAWKPLTRVQNVELQAHQRAWAAWKCLPKKQREEKPEPVPRRRLVSHDGTMEALQDILVRQTRGIGVVRDELAGWIGAMEKYAPGKGGAADRAFWLQSYNGGSHVVDRVMRGTMAIENLLTTICGGIQPDRLRQFGDLTDDGLWQRFVPIIVAPSSVGKDEPADETSGHYDALISSLLEGSDNRFLQLSAGAHAIREDVQLRMHQIEQADALGSRFTGFVGKMAGLWGRLCLVFHLIGENASSEVSDSTADAARTMLLRSVLPNAARVYTAMGAAGGDLEATQSIAGYILTKHKERIVVSDLTNNVRVCRNRTVEEVRRLISPLEAGGWLQPEKEYNPTAWLVSEHVHTFFKVRAEKETERRAMVRALITGAAREDSHE